MLGGGAGARGWAVAAATRLSTACRIDSVAFVIAVVWTMLFTSRTVVSNYGDTELEEATTVVAWLVGFGVGDPEEMGDSCPSMVNLPKAHRSRG